MITIIFNKLIQQRQNQEQNSESVLYKHKQLEVIQKYKYLQKIRKNHKIWRVLYMF
ncbi:unnamed protein product [Paramecium octaurelia]|uniref:Uncharacterized protein n=1 Tax=Paramecium octaurelia TaxID=43137 RepID=A0A8S1TIQ3_PAROT|nr:unnamed protein product [Paramecium octaurelia]